jgi:anti-anti-sigma factor
MHHDGPVNPESLHVEMDRTPTGCRMVISGELDMHSAKQFERHLEYSLLDTDSAVTLDLRNVSFCDSTGLRSLYDAVQSPRFTWTMWVSGPVRRILEITALLDVLPVEAGPSEPV